LQRKLHGWKGKVNDNRGDERMREEMVWERRCCEQRK
jgi:hypothetical protein